MWRQSSARLLAPVALLALPGVAAAQAEGCRPPATITPPRMERVDPRDVRRTPVMRYTLAMSWSPTHCTSADSRGDDFQCGTTRFGFVLHGLWPETQGRDWPQYCRPATPVPPATLRRNICMTPSADLLQHEWARHGVCMAETPDAYFDAARRAFSAIRFPDMAALARRPRLTAGDVAAAFAAANRGMRADMLAIGTDRDGQLDEVRLCLGASQRWARCPRFARGARASTPVTIPLR